MDFVIGQEYGSIPAEVYEEYKSIIDLSQFWQGPDGNYYIAAEDYDATEEELLDYGVDVDFFVYIKSTQDVSGL